MGRRRRGLVFTRCDRTRTRRRPLQACRQRAGGAALWGNCSWHADTTCATWGRVTGRGTVVCTDGGGLDAKRSPRTSVPSKGVHAPTNRTETTRPTGVAAELSNPRRRRRRLRTCYTWDLSGDWKRMCERRECCALQRLLLGTAVADPVPAYHWHCWLSLSRDIDTRALGDQTTRARRAGSYSNTSGGQQQMLPPMVVRTVAAVRFYAPRPWLTSCIDIVTRVLYMVSVRFFRGIITVVIIIVIPWFSAPPHVTRIRYRNIIIIFIFYIL